MVLFLLAFGLVVPVSAQVTNLTGTCGYTGDPLPSDAVLVVELLDVTTTSAPIVVAEQRIQLTGLQQPFSFSVPYEQTNISSAKEYAVRCRVWQGGSLLYGSDPAASPVFGDNPSSNINVTMTAAGVPAEATVTGTAAATPTATATLAPTAVMTATAVVTATRVITTTAPQPSTLPTTGGSALLLFAAVAAGALAAAGILLRRGNNGA
jgi:LPXTG-motif cell wall-anchored protein